MNREQKRLLLQVKLTGDIGCLRNHLYDDLKSRWKEIEPHIITDPIEVYYYARNVMKRRWHKAEKYLKQYEGWWQAYCKYFDIKP